MKFFGKDYCSAFTMAEVLITLGIIGIVAAMTFPSLIGNYHIRALETQYRRGIATISDGFNMMMAHADTPGDVGALALVNMELDSEELAKENRSYFKVLNDSDTGFATGFLDIDYSPNPRWAPMASLMPPAYATGTTPPSVPFEELKSGNKDVWSTVPYVFTTSDEIIYGYRAIILDDKGWFKALWIYMDVNGGKKPNNLNDDLYAIGINKRGKVANITCLSDNSCEGDIINDEYMPDANGG